MSQCVTRYGHPSHLTEANAHTPFGTLTFVAGGYGLIVFITDGREVGARISKLDQSALTEAEQKNIMAAETGSWTPEKSDDPSCLAWLRQDNSQALYDKEKHMLIFTSPAMSRSASAPTPAPSSSSYPLPATPGDVTAVPPAPAKVSASKK